MSTNLATAQNGQAVTEKKAFSRTTTVSIDIQADPSIVWALLTNVADFPRWNSTILELQGEIRDGQSIKLKSTLDPKRTFKLKVRDLESEKSMTWKGGMGKRLYTLESANNNSLRFTMTEKIGGPLFPLFAKMIPPFDEAFTQFAADLKKEAEAIQQTKG